MNIYEQYRTLQSELNEIKKSSFSYLAQLCSIMKSVEKEDIEKAYNSIAELELQKVVYEALSSQQEQQQLTFQAELSREIYSVEI